MTDLRTVALGAAAGTIALAIATRSRAVQAMDDAAERAAGRARARSFVLRAAPLGLPRRSGIYFTTDLSCPKRILRSSSVRNCAGCGKRLHKTACR